jgi:hypothetical protein
MKSSDKSTKMNEYAVAKALNESVNSLFTIIELYQTLGPLKEFNPDEINRAYLFLVKELESLYDQNSELEELQPKPVWRHFEIIKDKMYTVQKFLETNSDKHDHTLRLEKLCILSGQEIPELTSNQKKYISDAKSIHDKYMNLVIEEIKNLPEDTRQKELEKDPRNRRWWCIEEYNVMYKPDGTILVNNVLKLKKIHAGSTAERLLEQAVKNPKTLFKPDLGQTARNLSTVLSSAGFTPTLRELFFPIVSDDKGFVFRPKVTRSEVLSDRIDTYELDSMLYSAHAEIVVRPADELIALGLARPDGDE